MVTKGTHFASALATLNEFITCFSRILKLRFFSHKRAWGIKSHEGYFDIFQSSMKRFFLNILFFWLIFESIKLANPDFSKKKFSFGPQKGSILGKTKLGVPKDFFFFSSWKSLALSFWLASKINQHNEFSKELFHGRLKCPQTFLMPFYAACPFKFHFLEGFTVIFQKLVVVVVFAKNSYIGIFGIKRKFLPKTKENFLGKISRFRNRENMWWAWPLIVILPSFVRRWVTRGPNEPLNSAQPEKKKINV